MAEGRGEHPVANEGEETARGGASNRSARPRVRPEADFEGFAEDADRQSAYVMRKRLIDLENEMRDVRERMGRL